MEVYLELLFLACMGSVYSNLENLHDQPTDEPIARYFAGYCNSQHL